MNWERGRGLDIETISPRQTRPTFALLSDTDTHTLHNLTSSSSVNNISIELGTQIEQLQRYLY